MSRSEDGSSDMDVCFGSDTEPDFEDTVCATNAVPDVESNVFASNTKLGVLSSPLEEHKRKRKWDASTATHRYEVPMTKTIPSAPPRVIKEIAPQRQVGRLLSASHPGNNLKCSGTIGGQHHTDKGKTFAVSSSRRSLFSCLTGKFTQVALLDSMAKMNVLR